MNAIVKLNPPNGTSGTQPDWSLRYYDPCGGEETTVGDLFVEVVPDPPSSTNNLARWAWSVRGGATSRPLVYATGRVTDINTAKLAAITVAHIYTQRPRGK